MSTGDPAPSSQSYRERLPRADLGGLVSCVWVLQVSSTGEAYEHRTAPNGCMEFAYVLGSGVVHLAGPRRTPSLERRAPGETVVGIRFHPGVVTSVLGLSAAELIDIGVDLDRVWGSAALALGEKLTETATPQGAARLLEQQVAIRLAAASEPDPLVAEAVRRLQPWRRARVVEVASELFISPRQMRRRFVAALGYSPKAMQRILRFQGFLALGDTYAADNTSLARLAFIAGYADQAHLTRECCRLTGLTPTAFLEEMRRTCGPTHDHAASYAGLRRALLTTRSSQTEKRRDFRRASGRRASATMSGLFKTGSQLGP